MSHRSARAPQRYRGLVEVVGADDARRAKLVSLTRITPGSLVAEFQGLRRTPERSYLSVQVGRNEHVLLNSEFQYMNHSCDPNVYFDLPLMRIRALKNINIGDEITYFYPSTEWSMVEPFDCWCKSRLCLGRIAGAEALPPDMILATRDPNLEEVSPIQFADHIIELARETLVTGINAGAMAEHLAANIPSSGPSSADTTPSGAHAGSPEKHRAASPDKRRASSPDKKAAPKSRR